jgi:hypothetical protein
MGNQLFGLFNIVTPYHMKALAIIGIITPAAMRVSTVSKKHPLQSYI